MSSPTEANNWKHGLYAERSRYYRKIDDADRELIDDIMESFLERAPFDTSHTGKVQLLFQVAVDMHKRIRANEYIAKRGMTQEKYKDYHAEFGRPVEEDEENVLHITADRLQKTNLRVLKDLGLLDDPETQQAEAQQSLVDLLSSVDGDSDDADEEEDGGTGLGAFPDPD